MKKIILQIIALLIVVEAISFFRYGDLVEAPLPVTTYTDQLREDIPIITELNVNELELGKKHRFYFRTVQNASGQYWYLPITVIRGTTEGKRLVLVAGVHGNELNGIAVAGKISQDLDPQNLTGTVTVVHQVNLPGLLNNLYKYKLAGSYSGRTFATNSYFNVNKQYPEALNSHDRNSYNNSELASIIIWRNLLSRNADYAIDLHSAYKDHSQLFFALADFSNLRVRTMAKIIDPDLIVKDDGSEGTVETEFVDRSVPAVTLEIGTQEKYQPEFVKAATKGVWNFLIATKMIPGEITATSKAFVTTDSVEKYTAETLLFEPLVQVKAYVKKGQKIGVAYDHFGRVKTYFFAPATGLVRSISNFRRVEDREYLISVSTGQ